MYCNAYKSRTSDLRCLSRPLIGFNFCGKHMRIKNPRLWIDLNKQNTSATKIQKTWRMYMVRNMLVLLGNTLKQKEYSNTEDLFTFNDAPIFDTFEFCENGKNWWFDVRTIYDWTYRSQEPTNPYTKELLTIDTRKRLRELISLRKFRNLDTSHSTEINTENKFMMIYQIIEENGMDIDLEHLLNLNVLQITIILNYLEHSIFVWQSRCHSDISNRYLTLITLYRERQFIIQFENQKRLLANCILYMFRYIKSQKNICSMLVNAIYRSW